MMLPNISHIDEKTISAQPLTVLIGFGYKENHLLTELGAQAKTIAPHLGRALTDRIQQFAGSHNASLISNTDMQFYLQDWFMQLFQSRDDRYLESSKSLPHINQNILLTGIDVILTYGHEITQGSPNPEEATNAFHKALTLKIASEQLQPQVDAAQHLYEMMLLD